MNPRMKQAFDTCAKMYQVRETAKRLLGAQYAAKVNEAKALIEDSKIEPIKFLPVLAKRCAEEGQELSGFDLMVFTAATVELIEGRE